VQRKQLRIQVQGNSSTDAAYSTAAGNSAKELRAYKGWPRRVARAIEALAKTQVLEADALNILSKAATVDERNALFAMYGDASDQGHKYAAEI
jgi:hypothetical protein